MAKTTPNEKSVVSTTMRKQGSPVTKSTTTSRRSFRSGIAGGFLAVRLPALRAFTGDTVPTSKFVNHSRDVASTHLK
jgi:hypothetical protein